MPKSIDVRGRTIGDGAPCFVIAEAGVNHNGDLELARELVHVAASVGADAVKFQTFRANQLVNRDAPQADYQRRNMGEAVSQYEMLRRLELTEAAHVELIAECRKLGLTFLSTPFDEPSADLLERLDVPAFKVPSGEVTNLPFLDYLARKGRPLILSTGMSTLGEVEAAAMAVADAGNDRFVLLHCVSNYPAMPADVNLRAMETMRTSFGVPVGYSDHTLGNSIGWAAAALGACVIEKHFTLDRNLPGPDHAASLEPLELGAFIEGVRSIESALGDGRKRPAASEANTAAVARKSLVTSRPIASGTRITADCLSIKRPGTGLPPDMRKLVLDRTARCDIPAGTLLSLEMLG